MKDRIVFLGTEINDDVANIIIAQFLFLESEDPDKEVMLYINSPGGVVTSGLAIYDTMNIVRCFVSTTCLGMAASMGAVLLAAGHKGHRHALPNSRVMLHQPLGGARGQASDIEIQAREIRHLKDVIADILVNATGKSKEQIHKDIDRDFYLGAQAAKGIRRHRRRPHPAPQRCEGQGQGEGVRPASERYRLASSADLSLTVDETTRYVLGALAAVTLVTVVARPRVQV